MIEAGHRAADIPDYTIAQFYGYLDAVRRRQCDTQIEYLNLTALASRGDGRKIDGVVKQIRKTRDEDR